MEPEPLVKGDEYRSPEEVAWSAAVAGACFAGMALLLVVAALVEWLS